MGIVTIINQLTANKRGLGASVKIGLFARIGENTIIEDDVSIGRNSLIMKGGGRKILLLW